MNTVSQTPTNKIERALLIARCWRMLAPIPEGCGVTVVHCDCPVQHCECEIELELEGPRSAWEGNEDFADRMHAFLVAVDPQNYGERFIDPSPIMVVSMERRLEAMAARIARGFVAKNPRDIDASMLKVGETAARGRNGAFHSLGLEDIDDGDGD